MQKFPEHGEPFVHLYDEPYQPGNEVKDLWTRQVEAAAFLNLDDT